jgi:hypothetical protein
MRNWDLGGDKLPRLVNTSFVRLPLIGSRAAFSATFAFITVKISRIANGARNTKFFYTLIYFIILVVTSTTIGM